MNATPNKGRVLVVDDEGSALRALAALLRLDGYATETASDGQQALAMLETFEPDVVLTDMMMPILDGMGLVKQGRSRAPHASFVMMTASATIETAVQAIKNGAENFLTKPLDLEAVSALVERACGKAQLSREAAGLRERLASRCSVDNILGEHPSMQRLLKTIAQVAPSKATVLIQGESGTGKELIAAAIHQNSPRADKPFVRLNCAALAESLLESELFGHERGAFPGALTRREGRFRQAHEGTLFLDEVSEIPQPMQVKLLRFLQEKQFERVGGNETLTVDVRVVAASNRDLKERMKAGLFREDLFYRLNVVQVDVPPLRVRKSDIPLLASSFLQRFAADNGRAVGGFSDQALRALIRYPWPGNVRELENAVERAVVMCSESLIGVEHLPAVPRDAVADLTLLVPGISMAELERMAILQTLEAVGGSTAKAAEILEISRRKIQYRLKEWGIAETSTAEEHDAEA
ncbi:MAG: Response regulator of zinc sigma-54-dependent two-component system [Myxococcaceae bacterium]|nr:Response regulator of zinc sigma-54-dependent two-component system [Myxococcaceae bacterium]